MGLETTILESARVAPLVGETDNPEAETRTGNGNTIVGVVAIETALASFDSDESLLEVESTPAKADSGNRIFGPVSTRVRKIGAVLGMGLAFSPLVAACGNNHDVAAADRPPAAAASPFPQASGVGGQGGGELDGAPGRLDINHLTEKQAAQLSLDQIKQMVTDLGWADFSLLPGYTLTPDGRTASEFFNDYHNKLVGSTIYPSKEALRQNVLRVSGDRAAQCPALHLVAHGMDQFWYGVRCSRIIAFNDVPLPDDFEMARGDANDSVLQLPDGSLLSNATISSSKSVFRKDLAYLLTFSTGESQDTAGATQYYTLRIGAELYSQLAEKAHKTL